MMRAKMVVTKIDAVADGEVLYMAAIGKDGSYDEDGSDENSTFSKFTPSASLEMHINNPALSGKFKPGQSFYVDFTEVSD